MTEVTITAAHLHQACRLRRSWYRDENDTHPGRRSPTALAVRAVFRQRGVRASLRSLYRQDRAGRILCEVPLPEPVAALEELWERDRPAEIAPLLPLTFLIDLEPLRCAG